MDPFNKLKKANAMFKSEKKDLHKILNLNDKLPPEYDSNLLLIKTLTEDILFADDLIQQERIKQLARERISFLKKRINSLQQFENVLSEYQIDMENVAEGIEMYIDALEEVLQYFRDFQKGHIQNAITIAKDAENLIKQENKKLNLQDDSFKDLDYYKGKNINMLNN